MPVLMLSILGALSGDQLDLRNVNDCIRQVTLNASNGADSTNRVLADVDLVTMAHKARCKEGRGTKTKASNAANLQLTLTEEPLKLELRYQRFRISSR